MGCQITAKCRSLLELPVEAMTYRQIAERIGVRPKTARDYLRILREAGLTNKAAIKLRGGRRPAHLAGFNAKRIKDAEDMARERLRDTRPVLCPATWATYAAVLSAEEMVRHFVLKELADA